MMMLTLSWVKCEGSVWCSLENVNLANVTAIGVYIIWRAGNPSRVVRIGQGEIAARLRAHRTDPEILAHKKHGKLLVTWAPVSSQHLDGVEAYLADKWRPQVGEAFPLAQLIEVNSPWG